MKKKRPSRYLCDMAQEYYTCVTRGSAARKLKDTIQRCPPLAKALEKTGFTRTTRGLTPKQRDLIIKHLGKP